MSEQYSEDAKHIEKLYEFNERFSESTDKSQFDCLWFSKAVLALDLSFVYNRSYNGILNFQDYKGIIELSKTSIKTKQLGAQLIPRYFKFFTSLATEAFNAYMDINDEVDVGSVFMIHTNLRQGMLDHSKAMSAAKTDEEKSSLKTKRQNTSTGLKTCNNIMAMTKALHAKTPSFIGDNSITLSWIEATKPLASTKTGGKRHANGAGNDMGAKKVRVPIHQHANKRSEGVSYGGGRSSSRGRVQGRRGGGGRGRGRRNFW